VFLCAAGPTVFDNAPDTIRLLGFAIGLAGALDPGPTVLVKGFLTGARDGRAEELTLRVIAPVVGRGLAAGFFGAATLSTSVIRLAAGGLRPVSWSLRFAPPVTRGCAARRLALNVGGGNNCDVVSGSSGIDGGAGPRIDGLLSVGETKGDIDWTMLGDLSANGIFEGDGIFDGCGRREYYVSKYQILDTLLSLIGR
jgi:hypothetical protein